MEKTLEFPNIGWEKVCEEQGWVGQAVVTIYDLPT